VRVGVGGERGIVKAEHLGDHFRVDAFTQEQRDAGVPEVLRAQFFPDHRADFPSLSIGRVVVTPEALALHAAAGEKWSWITLGVS
jgi:hypothetical protein